MAKQNLESALSLEHFYMKCFFIVLIVSISTSSIYAQNRGSTWYFGANAGINFLDNSTQTLINGELNSQEGCSVISDKYGALRLYSDGVSIWNDKHQIIKNGDSLNGHPSSTQGVLIVPKPNSASIYYIFTTTALVGRNGLSYSIVDINSNNGEGEVLAKNIKLESFVCEKLCAVQHANKKDFWIISRKFTSDSTTFFSYLLTNQGVSASPIRSNLGIDLNGMPFFALGSLKASSDGSIIASANWGKDVVSLFHFDNKTGELSDHIKIEGFQNKRPYGIEFSPNNDVLYISESYMFKSEIYQFDISSYNKSQIEASKHILFTHPDYLGALQLGPNKSIYVSIPGSCFLGEIPNPNTVNNETIFNPEAINLQGRECKFGLPNFVNTVYVPDPQIKIEHICSADSATLFIEAPFEIDSINWKINETRSSNYKSNMLRIPISENETVDIMAHIFYNNFSDTILKTITIPSTEKFNLGEDTTLCLGNTILLKTNVSKDVEVMWQDFSNGPTYYAAYSGQYWVQFLDGGCLQRDTINIKIIEVPEFSLGRDTTLCYGESIILLVAMDIRYTLTWDDGTINQLKKVDSDGTYILTVSEDDCFTTDTIVVDFMESPLEFDLAKSASLCNGDSFILDLDFGKSKLYWFVDTKHIKGAIKENGLYRLCVANQCGVAEDSIYVNFEDCTCNIHFPNAFTPNGDNLNNEFKPVYEECIFKIYDFQIYNRWGNLLFKTDDPYNFWNGEYQGKQVQQGVYFYEFYYINTSNKKDFMRGVVSVLK